jgi:hypothetical protein
MDTTTDVLEPTAASVATTAAEATAGQVMGEGATGPVAAPAADRPAASSNRLLLVVVGGVAALVVVALAVVLLLPRGEATYPAGSPEAAFQAYLAAAETNDLEATYQAMSPRVRASWTYDEFVNERSMFGSSYGRRNVWIDSVDRRDDRAVLHVTIEWMYGEGLTASRSYDRDIALSMVLVDGTWYIDQRVVDSTLRY